MFGNFAERFSGNSQEDSQEFLTFVLDGLHEDLNKATGQMTEELRKKLKKVEDGSNTEVIASFHII